MKVHINNQQLGQLLTVSTCETYQDTLTILAMNLKLRKGESKLIPQGYITKLLKEGDEGMIKKVEDILGVVFETENKTEKYITDFRDKGNNDIVKFAIRSYGNLKGKAIFLDGGYGKWEVVLDDLGEQCLRVKEDEAK